MKNFKCSFSFAQRKWLLPISLAACILFSGAVSGYAQSDLSGVSGTITDSSGAVVRGATVTVTDEATGVVHTAATNDSGYYTIPSLSPGLYTISVTATNFQKTTSNGNNLDPNVSTTANLQLTVGSTSDVMEVSAQETAIQTESTVLGRVITSKQAEMLPLSGRNPITLALLKAGVTSTSGNVSNFQFSTGLGGLNINGARERDNLVTYDGAVAVRVRANGDSTGVVDLENVQEVQVLATNYPAEYGRSVGGQVRIITKAGTDKFHGSIYEYLQNPIFNANTWVRNHAANNNDPTLPQSVKSNYVAPFTYNQFGFSVNGPLYVPHVIPKGKVFFLYSEAFVRYPGTDTKPVTVPNPAFRSGDFSSIATHIRDPKAAGTCDPVSGGPACFPGNIIPKDRLSPNGVGLLSIFPTPTPGFLVGTQNLLQIAKHPQTQQIDTGNLDIIPTDKDYIRFRLTHFYYYENNPFSAAYSLVPRVFNRPAQTASLDWVRSFSPNTMNEVLITVAHSADRLFIDTSSGLYNRTKYGVNYPFLFPDGKDLPNKIPTVSFLSSTYVTGMDGSAYPSHSQGATFDYADTFTHIMGNHTLRAGALYERVQYNDYDQISGQNSVPGQTNNQNGKFEFTNANRAGTGLDLADAALGLFSSYAEVGARAETPYRSNMFEFFAQDSWKATPKLHVDYGMRYSIVRPFYSLWNNIGTFDPAFYNAANAVKLDVNGNPIPGSGDPLNGTVLFGNGFTESAKAHVALANTGAANDLFHNLPRGYMDVHYTTFQPRIGLSYAVNQKTVLRSGFGRYMSRQGVSDGVFEGGAPPLQSYAGISGGSADNPGGGAQGSFPTISGRVDRSSPQPESYVWNLSVERELPLHTVLGVAYVGRRGLHGQFQANMNQAPVGSVAAAKAAGLNINSYRPYAGYGPITIVWQGSGSTYNGLQLDLNHRFQKGVSFGLAYTYAHANDCGSFQKNFLPNFYDPKFLCGASDYDIRQAFTMNSITEIPFHSGSRLANQVLGGWQISQIYNFQTGVPLSVTTGTDIAGVGAGGGAQFYSTVDGARLGADGKFSAGTSDQNFWFNPKAFAAPAANTFTSQHTRNILRAPGVMNFNAGLQKKFQTFENQFLTFRFEAFNFPNHPNLSAPDTNPTSSTFGRVTSKTGQRSMQASLRYTF
ncbi:carboxypeptidase-like regulatory domain-containing protein [Edaphobacter sp. 12200R-103]|uniref:carboxypeptidase-like regulatory domain-containing protein n=1 Tax=Edaphobacter sp. 12200R-103 TaxID=2703788 RepID=UPI00138CD9B6|nr:carboxypeptidase-like regulatory domain-containing protein [Edaphobacter sp. 12200R-103]QHS50625.1 TonB-dependent receptor [Edaphobacter sp. 12200R-103]